MSDAAEIRVAKSDREVFQQILLSLESHRQAKAEKDVLEKVQERFGLPSEREEWPDILVSKGESAEAVLDFVLEQLGPFVNMVLDLYRFLSKMVSTTGGRTSHFEISADDMNYRLEFPNVDFPKKVKWIQGWGVIHTQIVKVDWNRISEQLIIDNGIFYGTVREIRLVQSLIIGRRDRTLSPEAEAVANRIYETLLRALRAWWAGYLTENPNQNGQSIASAFVPELHSELAREGRTSSERRADVGIDLDVVLRVGGGQYSEREAFTDASKINVDSRGRDDNSREFVSDALFFVALWGLYDSSFVKVASLLTAHESRPNIVRGYELNSRSKELSEEVLATLESAIVPTGETEESEGVVSRKLEILLLPYWKDRWFLYEVWSLSLPLNEAMSVGSSVELLGIETISNQDVKGTTWNLPTQKARQPVAKLSGPLQGRELLVWFQRETKSRSEPRNIEPDVRITKSSSDYEDLLILECKDRIKFGKSSSEQVAQTYLDGSLARAVWIVNYEEGPPRSNQYQFSEINGRYLGIAYNFKPRSNESPVRSSIRELFETELCPLPALHVVIDISGSMSGKLLPPLPASGSDNRRAVTVYLWNERVRQIDLQDLVNAESINDLGAAGVETASALESFAASLPPEVALTVVTDESGRAVLDRDLAGHSRVPSQISGHPVEFIVI